MQHAPAAVDGGIDNGVPGPAILGLHVIMLAADAYVRIVAEQNSQVFPSRARRAAPWHSTRI